MSFVGRIEADPATGEFRNRYLTGAAEWSLDPKAAFHGTNAECVKLAGQQPLRCLIFTEGDDGQAAAPSPKSAPPTRPAISAVSAGNVSAHSSTDSSTATPSGSPLR